MSLPLPANVSVDIYRTTDPSDPYPGGSPAVGGVPGYLQPAVTNGRFGTAEYLKWTHILFLPPTTDVRDAYNTQIDPARDDSLADTVIVNDSAVAGRQTAYYVAFVEVIGRGSICAPTWIASCPAIGPRIRCNDSPQRTPRTQREYQLAISHVLLSPLRSPRALR